MHSLSLEDLNKAAVEIKTTGKCTNPAILTLERQLQIVASHSPHSFAKCAEQNLFIRSLMISNGMSIIWITLNPSDFRSFLVLILASVRLEDSGSSTSAEKFRWATAVMNPVAVAQFFEAICTGILKRLLAAGSTGEGLRGPVSTYYGTVETNGRGMLHLHCLVGLHGAFHLADLGSHLQSDPQYATDILQFIDTIISYSLADKLSSENIEQKIPAADVLSPEYIGYEAPSASLDKTDTEFALALYKDSNAVASKTQVHSSSHMNATYFKYGAAVSRKYRFDFPHSCIDKTRVTGLGFIEISRNHPWINPWNPALTLLIRSNHDINFIPSNVKALALVHYITNYAKKWDCSQYQHVVGIAFI